MIINFESLGGGSSKLSASAFTDVVLNTSASTLDFYNINGDLVEQFDASSLIIDGMVEDVYLSGTTLVIDFNTESGKQDIEIDLTDFFNPEIYWTSAQTQSAITEAISTIDLSAAVASAATYTDTQISGITDHISSFERTAAIALNELHNDVAEKVDSGWVESAITVAISGIDLSAAVASAATYTDTQISGVTSDIVTIQAQIVEDEQVTSAALNDLVAEINALKQRVTTLENNS